MKNVIKLIDKRTNLRHNLQNGNHFQIHRFAAHIRSRDDEEIVVGRCNLKIIFQSINAEVE